MTRVVGLAKLASVVLLTAALAACERSATAPIATEIVPRLDRGGSDQDKSLEAPAHTGGTARRTLGHRGGHVEFDDPSARGIDYELDVPAGAVDGSTTFELKVLPGRTYLVSLTATGADGTDVGKHGFKQPVRLTISYSTAKHPAPAGHLQIVWLPDDGSTPVPVKTQVNSGQKTITGFLPHFSRYTVWF